MQVHFLVLHLGNPVPGSVWHLGGAQFALPRERLQSPFHCTDFVQPENFSGTEHILQRHFVLLASVSAEHGLY